jgi:hypothetical protein
MVAKARITGNSAVCLRTPFLPLYHHDVAIRRSFLFPYNDIGGDLSPFAPTSACSATTGN